MLLREKTGLILVDVQGKLARTVHNSESLIASCEKLVQGANALELPIIVLEQNPEKLGETVHELKRHLPGIAPIKKYCFDACKSPEVLDAVKKQGVDTWLICGIEAHICVYQTTLGLLGQGYKIEVVSDCVSSRDAAHITLGIDRLRASGAQITAVEMCLYELVQDCRAPEFRDILNLVR